LFELLGWDVANKARYAEQYREVIREDKVSIVLSLHLPMRAIVAVTQHWKGEREVMKSFLRYRAPGVFLFLKRLRRGHVSPEPHAAAHGHQEGPPRS
jgi:hypothetical protein